MRSISVPASSVPEPRIQQFRRDNYFIVDYPDGEELGSIEFHDLGDGVSVNLYGVLER